MADYYPLLAKAIAALPKSTPQTRGAIYERAKKALLGQLNAMQPPPPHGAIEREAQALDEAVARLEREFDAADALAAELLKTEPSEPPPPPVVEETPPREDDRRADAPREKVAARRASAGQGGRRRLASPRHHSRRSRGGRRAGWNCRLEIARSSRRSRQAVASGGHRQSGVGRQDRRTHRRRTRRAASAERFFRLAGRLSRRSPHP